MNKLLYISALYLTLASSCHHATSKLANSVNQTTSPEEVRFIKLQNGQTFTTSTTIDLQIDITNTENTFDSIQFLADGIRLAGLKNAHEKFSWNTTDARVGSRIIQALVYKKAEIVKEGSLQLQLLPGTPAKEYTYRVLNAFPHDITSYTQGLVYDNGILFEGTGLYGHSLLRKVAFQTGKVLKETSVPNNIFGEGITTFDGKIIQISWKEQVAYLYDKNTFKQINKFVYPIAEGWGITYNGSSLVMSDGSANLYFMDKEYFIETSRIEVCDENGPVDQLNELEYIDGEVWANVYMTDTIVRINPKTGAVTGKIIMSNLLKPEDRKPGTDVLNGIAYDTKTKRLWVTGKNWPKLFQIEVEQRGK